MTARKPSSAEKLYVCGGVAARTHITVEHFDPALETWELLRPTLHQRVGATVAVPRDRLYLVGGRGDDDIALDSVECYDPDTDSWAESAPMSKARCGAKVVRMNGSLHVSDVLRGSSALPHERRGVWPPGRSHALHTGYEPKEFDKITSVDGDTTPINDPNYDSISDFSKTTRECTGLFGVPTCV